jgi:hypothetical protein
VSLRCQPTWHEALTHQRAECAKAIGTKALELLVGQPRPYNWAKQNYNGGWDQAMHRIARECSDLADALEAGEQGGDRDGSNGSG